MGPGEILAEHQTKHCKKAMSSPRDEHIAFYLSNMNELSYTFKNVEQVDIIFILEKWKRNCLLASSISHTVLSTIQMVLSCKLSLNYLNRALM